MQKSRIGPFALEGKLDPRQTGSVMRAIHVEKSLPAALKIFPAPLVVKSEFLLYQYVQEFRKLKRLEHPNIAKCYGGGFEGQYGYIAWELIKGRSLHQDLKRRGRLSWDVVVDFGTKIALALEHAHDQEILHGNLSLDKVLVEKQSGELRVVDFRITHHVDSEYAPMRLPTLNELTILAPERMVTDSKPSVASDIYSLGAMLYQMLTSRQPYEAESRRELVELKRTKVPHSIRETILDCPIWLDALVVQMLEPNPDRRPVTATAVRLAFEETKRKLAEGTTVTEHAAGGLSALHLKTDRTEAQRVLGVDLPELHKPVPEASKPWGTAATLALLLLIVFGGLAALFWPLSPQEKLDRAANLIATEKAANIRQAEKQYLKPLIAEYPGTNLAEEAQSHLDHIIMDRALKQLTVKQRLGKPYSEIERLFLNARKIEEFGDQASAAAKYDAIVQLFDENNEAQRPIVLLARSRLRIQAQGAKTDRGDFLNDRMTEAQKLVNEKRLPEALSIYRGIVQLYASVKEVAPIVAQAQKELDSLSGS